MARNDFPDLERSAEDVGERRFPLGVDDLQRLYRRHRLEIHWFDQDRGGGAGRRESDSTLMRSFFEAPSRVYINRRLEKDAARLKYDLAAHLGHKVLHGGDGLKSPHATGTTTGVMPEGGDWLAGGMNAQDVLFAWRDFESSFFAGALLCPKRPFRRFLMRVGYRVEAGCKLDLTPGVIMRRMTAVSPYRYWHFFDAYPPGYLRAVYRGNGIPLPWGNMAMVTDPCPSWAVFRMLRRTPSHNPASQISVLQDGSRSLLYCCHSLRTEDLLGHPHVLSVGVDLAPALASQGTDAEGIVQSVAEACRRGGGSSAVPAKAERAIQSAGKVLNVAWIADALQSAASIICPRSTACPRPDRCEKIAMPERRARVSDIRAAILREEVG
jgi:hypothetical protein